MGFNSSLVICCAFVTIMLSVHTQGNTIETQGSYTEFMSRTTTLTCKFLSDDSPMSWIFFRWNKIDPATNKSIPLAILTSQSPIPEWAATAPAHFKDHVVFQTDLKATYVTFNMRIDGFICTDAGRYMCQMFTLNGDYTGHTDLNIEAHPGTPMITENTIEVSENETFRIECKGNVGIPPQQLRWAYKMPGQETYTKLRKNVTHENKPAEDCTVEEISRVTLVMTPELDGTVFLCMSRGELGDGGTPLNFDEVTVIKHRPPTTTTLTLSSTVIIIDDGNGPAGVATFSSSSSELLISAIVLTIMTVLVTGS